MHDPSRLVHLIAADETIRCANGDQVREPARARLTFRNRGASPFVEVTAQSFI